MTDYEEDLDDDIEDNNKEVNHSDNNNKDGTQYVMAAHLFNKSFMHLLMVQDILLSNKASIAQYFVFNQYAETVFQGIIPDTGVSKVLTAGKGQFRAL